VTWAPGPEERDVGKGRVGNSRNSLTFGREEERQKKGNGGESEFIKQNQARRAV